MLPQKPKIIVVGAGFAGLRTVQNLNRVNAEITLIDRHNYHTFIPLLYQVATGFIPPEVIAYPLRKYLRGITNVNFVRAEVESVDFERKTILTDTTSLTYDYLVLATGSQTKFLGVEGAPKHSLPMRTLSDAVRLRDRIISNFERAAVCNDWERRQQLLTFTIVGGGATGVELAGAIIELITETLVKDYPALDFKQVRVILIHSGKRLLADYPEALSQYTLNQLRRRGVKVHLESRVSTVMPGAVELDDGTLLETGAVIWTAGVEANLPEPNGELATTQKEKVCVRSTLQLLQYPEVYAMGDVAHVRQNGEPLLGIAPEALQQGSTVASNLKRQLRGLSPQPFDYFNKGKAAIIARNAGVAYLLGRIPLKGFLAWLLWLGIHLYYLPGISNRFIVLGSWIRDYLTKQRDIRQFSTAFNSDRHLTQSHSNSAISYKE